MGNVEIRLHYLVHEGGTKFYEVVEFHNPSAPRYVVVRRWGKIGARVGGGEIKIEEFAGSAACSRAANDVVAAKLKRGYSHSSADFGFGNRGGSFKTASPDLEIAMIDHYRNSDTQNAILKSLNVGMESIGDADENDVVEEAPAPEPVRDGDWGSW